MIKATELRIGNWYTHIHGKGHTDIQMDEHILGKIFTEHDPEYALDDFNDIPLTEERLIGFEFSNKDYKKGYIGIDVKHTDFVLCYPRTHIEHSEFFCWEHQHGRVPLYNELKYVHELQNIFRDLNSEELTTKQ